MVVLTRSSPALARRQDERGSCGEETLHRALDPTLDPPESVEAVAVRYAEAAPRYGMEFLVD